MATRADRTTLLAASRVLGSLWFSMVFGSAAAFVAQVLAARLLGTAAYGALSAALAAVGIIAPLVGFGIGSYWLRAFGLGGHAAQRWLGPSIKLTRVTSAIGVALLVVWAFTSGMSSSARDLTLLLLPLAATQGVYELMQSRLQLEERYYALSAWQSVPNTLRLVTVAAVTLLGGSVWWLAAGYSLGALLVGAFGIAGIAAMSHGRWTLKGHESVAGDPSRADRTNVIGLMRESWPFALAGLFYLIYYQSDIVIVAWLSGDGAAGVYQVAVVMVAAVYLLPNVVFQRYLLPKLHRWAEHNRTRFLAVYRFGCGLMSVLGLLAAFVVAVVAPAVVGLIFGSSYAAAGSALRVLAVGVAAHYVATAVGAVLVTGDHMRRKVKYQGVTAALNVGLNLVLVPALGFVGAAVSTATCEVLLAVMYLVAVRRHVLGEDAWSGWTLRYRENTL